MLIDCRLLNGIILAYWYRSLESETVRYDLGQDSKDYKFCGLGPLHTCDLPAISRRSNGEAMLIFYYIHLFTLFGKSHIAGHLRISDMNNSLPNLWRHCKV